MKNVVILSASPKASGLVTSEFLASLAEERLKRDGMSLSRFDVRACIKQCDKAFAAMRSADAIVIMLPLYYFCLSGMLMRFLQDYALQKPEAKAQKVYTFVNCGFPEPEINSEAIRVVQSFCRHIGASFRMGVGIGGGGMLAGAKDAPFMKKTMQSIADAIDIISSDIQGDVPALPKTISIGINFPSRLYFFMGNWGWSQASRQNGLKKKDLYAKPYCL